jgi:hypothetical protein
VFSGWDEGGVEEGGEEKEVEGAEGGDGDCGPDLWPVGC